MAEDIQRQRQELEALQAVMREDLQNLEQAREQVRDHKRAMLERKQVLLRWMETAREEARQPEQEAREQLERRERQIADKEAEMTE